ncbi:MAG: zinc ABC transporter substrate-binding protein [Planctomycetaceae bacterium]|nr:zinc ABC transporter substrate-binding protein [Planctomycetaceae bacterium]
MKLQSLHKILLPFFPVIFAGCTQLPQEETSSCKVPSVVVSIEPQKFFVERIAGDRVHVEVLVPTGKEPETYVPTPDKIKKLAQSRVFFRIGFPSEETFLPKLQTLAPRLKVVDTRKGLPLRALEEHDHGETPCGDGADPHVWLSPTLVLLQTETILQALVELDPEGKALFEENAEIFRRELEQARTEIAAILASHKGETVYVFHPAYGYFCDEFGLKQRAIEVEGKSPKMKELAQWKHQAEVDHARVILIQPEFNPAPAELIAGEIGAKVVVHSTLGPSYLRNLVELAKIIATAGNL